MERQTFYEEDTSSAIKVTFKRREAINSNTWKATIIRNGEEDERVWGITYEDREIAIETEDLLRRFRSDNICGVKFLNLNREEPFMFIEEGYELFEHWLKKKSPIWEYNHDNTKVLSMGFGFVSVFKGIIGGLRRLHYNKKFHGNLLNGVTVSHDYKVKLFNICFKKGDDGHFDRGIQEDLKDLTELVNRVLRKHPPINHLPEPECVVFFRQFEAMLAGIDVVPGAEVTKSEFQAYYTYHQPVFADANDRHNLMTKFIQLDKYCSKNLMGTITLNEPPTSMDRWWLRIRAETILFERFYYNMGKVRVFREKPREIIDFYRSMHHADEDEEQRRSDAAIEVLLNETFPDFLPKLYFEFVRKLAWKDSGRPVSFMKYFQALVPMFE